MEKLLRMLTICLIFFASMESTVKATSMLHNVSDGDVDGDRLVSSEKLKTDTDPTWTLNVHFTTWTLNGTFRVSNIYDYESPKPRPQFKNDRNILDSENNVTVAFQTKINSFIQGKMDVDLILDNWPYHFNAAKIVFHRVRRNDRPDGDAVLPVISSPQVGDPFARKVRGICYILHDYGGVGPYSTQYEYKYDLFIQCDRVQPYPSVDVSLSNFTAENYYSRLRDEILKYTNRLQGEILAFSDRAVSHLDVLIRAEPHQKG